ncbi:MAG: ATP-binding protein [Paludibacter sp.]|nr:ATP-binding protein [Paludibacter sp.]
MVIRDLQTIIESNVCKGKAIVLIGARQVGKTTLIHQVSDSLKLSTLSLNCDEPETRELLTNTNTVKLKQLIGSHKLLLIDEAQRVKNIGLTLKIIIDTIKDVQLLVTGSSSFELANEINEPLTGRKFEYNLFPFSTNELVKNSNFLEEKQSLEQRLIYGSYPDIINRPADAAESLYNIVGSYLYKDILAYNDVRKPAQLEKLVQALALQIGSEVSYSELGQIIQADNQTVERYIDLLEQSFVIFRLSAFSGNIRNEIKKGRKVYFYDNGVRNAVIQNFSPLKLRQDVGALWENYFISERKKWNHYNRTFSRCFFWRSFQQQEIDLIEQENGELRAYELKWNVKKMATVPKTFTNNYNLKANFTVTPHNYFDFLTNE